MVVIKTNVEPTVALNPLPGGTLPAGEVKPSPNPDSYAKALGDFGAGLKKAGGSLESIVETLQKERAATTATEGENAIRDGTRDAIYTGPDAFMAKKGKDAVEALPNMLKMVDETYAQFMATVPAGQEKEVRARTEAVAKELKTALIKHAANENVTTRPQQAQAAAVATAKRGAAAAPGDPQNVLDNYDRGLAAKFRELKEKYGSNPDRAVIDREIGNFNSQFTREVIDASNEKGMPHTLRALNEVGKYWRPVQKDPLAALVKACLERGTNATRTIPPTPPV